MKTRFWIKNKVSIQVMLDLICVCLGKEDSFEKKTKFANQLSHRLDLLSDLQQIWAQNAE